MVNRKLFFVYHEYLYTAEQGNLPGFFPGVITALGSICSSGEYELVLVDPGDEVGAAQAEVNPVLQLLRNEGISFIDVAAEHQVIETWEGRGPKEGIDLGKCVAAGPLESVLSLAARLSCRSLVISSSPLKDHEGVLTARTWKEAAGLLLDQHTGLNQRKSEISRITSETDVSMFLNLDGSGSSEISTGIGFLDHMLHQLAKHGNLDLFIRTEGDLEIDEHHTIEDTAIVLGQAFLQALGDKRGINRYGFLLPMDDALAQASIDFSGRPWLVWDVTLHREYVGDLPTDMIYHFFKSFSDEARCNLSLKAQGMNDHHIIEALFKAFARAIRMAVKRDPFSNTLPSTKGAL